jgi:hypothetical protein
MIEGEEVVEALSWLPSKASIEIRCSIHAQPMFFPCPTDTVLGLDCLYQLLARQRDSIGRASKRSQDFVGTPKAVREHACHVPPKLGLARQPIVRNAKWDRRTDRGEREMEPRKVRTFCTCTTLRSNQYSNQDSSKIHNGTTSF